VVRRAVGLALIALLAGGWDGLRQADPDVDQGNQAFREGRFADALGHYRAAGERGDDPRLHFDAGAALYRLGEKNPDPAEKARLFQQAEEELRRAADTDDAALKSSAYYNLGNTLYQRQQWDDAIGAYKRSLRADPKNDAARHNLEMALRQRQQDPQQKDKQQGQQQKDKQGKQDKQQGQKDKQAGQQGDQDKQQDGQPGDQDDQDQDGQGQPQKPEPPPGQKDQDGQQPDQQQGQEAGQPDQQRGQAKPPQGEQGKSKDQERGRPVPPEQQPDQSGSSESDSPSDQDRKLDELERRSRDLRKRLLRQGSKNRDPMRLPSRRDW